MISPRVRYDDPHWLLASVAQDMRRRAQYGTYNGIPEASGMGRYLDRCRAYHQATGTVLIFTRDAGAHDGGWFKNPDYDQCYHLSLSYRDPATEAPRPHDHRQSRAWAEAFFQQHCRLLWVEPAYCPEGRRAEVYHYRLFCDRSWQPLLPRKEVYSTAFTEIGWKSWSELHGDHPPVEPPLGRE